MGHVTERVSNPVLELGYIAEVSVGAEEGRKKGKKWRKGGRRSGKVEVIVW